MIKRKIIQLNNEKVEDSNISNFSPTSYTSSVGDKYIRNTDNLLNFSLKTQGLLNNTQQTNIFGYKAPSNNIFNPGLNSANNLFELQLNPAMSFDYVSQFSSSIFIPGISYMPGLSLAMMPMFPFSISDNDSQSAVESVKIEPSNIKNATPINKKTQNANGTTKIKLEGMKYQLKDGGEAETIIDRQKGNKTGENSKFTKTLTIKDAKGNVTAKQTMEAVVNKETGQVEVTEIIARPGEEPVERMALIKLEEFEAATGILVDLTKGSNNRGSITTKNIPLSNMTTNTPQSTIKAFIQATQNKQATGEELIGLLADLKNLITENPNSLTRLQPIIERIENRIEVDKTKCDQITQSDFVKENNLKEHMKAVANVTDMISQEIDDTKTTIKTIKSQKAAAQSKVTITNKKTTKQDQVINQIMKKIIQTFAEQQSKDEVEQTKKENAAKEAIMKAINKKLDQKEIMIKKLVKNLEAKIEQLKDQNKEAIAAKLQVLVDEFNSQINNNQNLADAA